MKDNYALYLLKTALRNEILARQQACEVLDGLQPHHTPNRDASLEAFSESLKLADKRIPELLDGIHQIVLAMERIAKIKIETKVNSIMFFPNGNTAAFDDKGEQIPELQESWFMLYIEHLQQLGYDPTTVEEIRMPNNKTVKVFTTEDGGLNWQ